MRRCHWTALAIARFLIGGALVLQAARFAAAAQVPSPGEHTHTASGHDDSGSAAIREPGFSGRGGGELELVLERARRSGEWLIAWYTRTPPAHRVTWGGMAACAGLGLLVLLERLAVLRRRKIVPASFTARFLDRLHDGQARLRTSTRSLRAQSEPGGTRGAGGGEAVGAAGFRPRARRCAGASSRDGTTEAQRGNLAPDRGPGPASGFARDPVCPGTHAGGKRRFFVGLGACPGRRAHAAFNRNRDCHPGPGRLRRFAHPHRKTGWRPRSAGGRDH